jgi:poly-beta-1,6-N-acetyl-D-glucosamine synthase
MNEMMSVSTPNFLYGSDLSSLSLNSTLVFLCAYPFVTCLLWTCSGLFYLFCRRQDSKTAHPTRNIPTYTVVIPFHAEPEAALSSLRSLAGVSPSPREIIIIDDGSPRSIPSNTVLPGNTRIVRLTRNLGKAGAMQSVLAGLKTDLVITMDADTQSESKDWSAMLAAFDDPALAAVTGKIRPVDGGGIVEWFQALDYLTVIAVIKAAESAWGGLLTVSGAFTAYRVSALRSIGGWSDTSSTEDIDASWRLQSLGWRLAFEADWIARVEMAPNLPALWCQRRRWSAGLGRALRDHGAASLFSGARHLPIVVLTLASLSWIVSSLAFAVHALLNWSDIPAATPDPGTTVYLPVLVAGILAFYIQLFTSLAVDGQRPSIHWRSALIAPLYPIYFWGVLLSSFLVGFPKGFMRLDKCVWQRTLRRIEVGASA